MYRLLLLTACLFAQQGMLDEAMRFAAQGRLPEARSLLEQMIANEPKDADLHYRLGLVLTKQNLPTEAERELQQALKLQPDYVFAWLAISDVHLRQGDRARALQDAAQASKLAADSAAAWKALALLRGRLGDAQGETVALKAVLRLAPDDRSAYARLANRLIENRDGKSAERVTGDGLKRFPGDADLLRLHGLACYGSGRKAEAVASFLAAMDAAPDNDLVHSSIETLLADAGEQLPAIMQRLQRYRKSRPDVPLGPYLLALATGAIDTKAALLHEALAIDKTFWPGWFELHRLLLEQGKRDAALQALLTTVELKPDHEAAHFALAEMYLAAGDRSRARAHRAIHHKLRAAAVAPVP